MVAPEAPVLGWGVQNRSAVCLPHIRDSRWSLWQRQPVPASCHSWWPREVLPVMEQLASSGQPDPMSPETDTDVQSLWLTVHSL